MNYTEADIQYLKAAKERQALAQVRVHKKHIKAVTSNSLNITTRLKNIKP